MKWYERRGGCAAKKDILDTWVRLMAPFTPHICEEIWERSGKDFISLDKFPEADISLIDRGAELAEEITGNTLRDIEEILRLIKLKPKRIILYTSASWKKNILKKAILMKKDNVLDMKNLMSELMSDPQMHPQAKDIPKFAQKIITDVQGMENELMISLTETDFDETSALRESLDFLKRVVDCDVEVFNADDAGYDPQGKSRFAVPMRPAIYIE
jgi:leucyl-tRNA synthetase